MGFATVVGGSRATAPSTGILASDLAVGSTVKLLESGSAVEYLVVHQGLPSSIYDDSCNGCWLLRKDIYESRAWHSSNVNDYANSTIHSYLNSTFLGLLDSNAQSAVKQVKIPYRAGSGYDETVTSGASGLSTKIFLLSATEVGLTGTGYAPTNEGATLSYFSGTATSGADTKRVAYLNGSAAYWWLRSPYCDSYYGSERALYVFSNGFWSSYGGCSSSGGIRPALILPSNALFDADTMILKGVA